MWIKKGFLHLDQKMTVNYSLNETVEKIICCRTNLQLNLNPILVLYFQQHMV